jgi:hypothetical protein
VSYARDAGAAVRRQSDELARLARAVGYEAEVEVVTFVRTLLAYLMRADGGLGGEERLIQSEYNRDGLSWQEEDDYSRNSVLDASRFLRTVPGFVVAGKEHDDRLGTSYASAMVTCVAAICCTVVGVDGTHHPDETETAAVLLSTLRSAIDTDGEAWRPS